MPKAQIGTLEELHEEASRRTGLSDFGGDDYREPMARLRESYLADAGLTETGAGWIEGTLVTVLQSRLHTAESYQRHPEAADATIRRPMFVTGLPRTGTTALHRLLCVDPANQGMEHWLTEAPQPRPPRDRWGENPAYRRMQRLLEAQHAANPGMRGLHFMSPETVEECWRAERQSMLSIAFQNTAHVPGYAEWLAGQDMTPAYRAHQRVLRIVGLNDPERRWVLKSPSHLFGLDALMATYPDALVIQTHRHPSTIIASVSSLNATASRGTSTVYTPEVIGADCLDLWSRGATEFAKARERYDAAQFIDVRYEDFVADAPGVVADVYAHFGLAWDQSLRDAVAASHEESKVSDRRPSHRYSLPEFGLSEDDVGRRFDVYLSRYYPDPDTGADRIGAGVGGAGRGRSAT